jgi:hypothetical protein
MEIDYTGRLSHYVNIDTQVYLPIYSESYKLLNGLYVSIDDIDERNIHYRRFNLKQIKNFKKPINNNPGFSLEYCILETMSGMEYPIHGSIKEWEKQYEKWREINNNIYHDLNIELSKIISKK